MGMIVLLLALFQGADESALLQAARQGDIAGVRAALAGHADVDAKDADGRTALMAAAARVDRALVELLLQAGADAQQRDNEGVSALTIAKADGSPEIVALLREAGARESAEELLDEAVRAGDVNAVERLVSEGVDVNALDTDAYQTPLMTALETRQLEVFLRLIDAGADPTREGTGIATTGENAISVAARQESPWALRLLLKQRARQSDLNRALVLGCTNAAVIGVALEAGAQVDARDADGKTALMCAASAGASDAVAALLEAGANVDAESSDGRTARDWATVNGFDELARELR